MCSWTNMPLLNLQVEEENCRQYISHCDKDKGHVRIHDLDPPLALEEKNDFCCSIFWRGRRRRGKRLELAWLEFWGAVWYGGDKGCERGKEVGGERKRQRALASMLWRCEEWHFREKGEEVRSNLRTHCCLSCKVMPILFLHDWCKDFSYLSTGFLDMRLRLGLGLLSFEGGTHTEVNYEEKALFGLHCDFICAKIKCVCIMALYICIKTFWKQPKNIFIM